jgi:transcriptional regulator with XRE-family HTH domain
MTSSTATVCPVISEPRPRLRAERLRRNLSREDAARRIGITERTLRELELGNHVPHDRTMIRIADYYGVSVLELFPESATPRSQRRSRRT